MKWDTPEALAAYLEDNPTSDAMREAAKIIRALGAENARLREALGWTAGLLQSACEAGHISEDSRAKKEYRTMTVGQTLDMADAALTQEQGGSDVE